MEIKMLGAEAAWAEIARLEGTGGEGCVVNIAERLWAGCAPDDAYREEVRAAHDILIWHSAFRPGMVDLVLPEDLCVCVVERAYSKPGRRLLDRATEWLRGRGVAVGTHGTDFLVADLETRTRYKIGSWSAARRGDVWETTLHISIHADNRLLRAFRAEPPELERAGLDRWGISAEPLWEAMREEVADT